MLTPIIMESSMSDVAIKIAKLRESGQKRVHFDVGDGMFSDYMGVTPTDLSKEDLRGMEVDIHLLVDDPTEWVEESKLLSPARIIGQVERMGSPEFFLRTVGESGGLALGLQTPIETLSEEALKMACAILLLAVPAGTSGSVFDNRVIEKIVKLKKIYGGAIIVDGGIDPEVEKLVCQAGASEVAANSHYWKGDWK